jgi:hypothetical protein
VKGDQPDTSVSLLDERRKGQEMWKALRKERQTQELFGSLI